jgi:hypothetical protein
MTEPDDASAITYDEMCENRPQIFTVDRHQTFDDTGTILVSAPPAMDMVPMRPGTQLNYVYRPGDGVVGYSLGPDEADDGQAKPTEAELAEMERAKAAGDPGPVADHEMADVEARTGNPGFADAGSGPDPRLEDLGGPSVEGGSEQGTTDDDEDLAGLDDALAGPEANPELEAALAEQAERDANLATVPDGEEFPWHKGGGVWILADGQRYQGNRDGAGKANDEVIALIDEAGL